MIGKYFKTSVKPLNKKDFSIKLGKRIRKIRESVGISQEELGHRAGFYRTYVGHIETGVKSPSAYTVWKLAKALGVDISDIFSGL